MKRYKLIGEDGTPYESATPGTLGGHKATRIYGRLDCPSALRAIERGGYVTHRVFFGDEGGRRRRGLPTVRQVPARSVQGVEGGA
jgi:hypothetical protein